MALTKVTGSGADGLALSSTDVTVASGDLLFGTANKGVVLGVTSNTDGNTLDDYEEGTWSPRFRASADISSTSGWTIVETTVSNGGVYRKVGDMCTIFVPSITRSNMTGGSSALIAFTINDLPFTSADSSLPDGNTVGTGYNGMQGKYSGNEYVGVPELYVASNVDYAQFQFNFQSTASVGSGYLHLEFTNSMTPEFTLTYRTA